jgi:hydrogenase expression/formation protein HypD
MKYLDEYRNPQQAALIAKSIGKLVTGPWTLMEICGGQTHSILRFGLDKLLPEKVSLLHGPGCPVCVTPVEIIDAAIEIAKRHEVILCSFGDMLRVPGTQEDLISAKAKGGDVRIVYSPLDALALAQSSPGREVVFFAVGFETTAPANAMAVYQASLKGVKNFSILSSHVLVPPAIDAILSSPWNKVQGFLAAGHVCTIMGYEEYLPLAQKYKVPIVVTGFEPLDLLQGIEMCLRQLEEGRYEVENQYSRSVKKEGNLKAIEVVREVFEVGKRNWRGIGEIEKSGLWLRVKYADFDALKKFKGVAIPEVKNDGRCISGLVLQGIKKPLECRQFGTVCTPEKPLGATMVSSEGACAAYYRYRFIAGEN